jgi:hypothetical protein
MRAIPPTAVVSDASVALKWFHERGEEDIAPARALLDAYAAERIGLVVLDLTLYEVGNALLRGPAAASPDSVATVLEALGELCRRSRSSRLNGVSPRISPSNMD